MGTSNFKAKEWGRLFAVQAWLSPCARNKLDKDMVRRVWCGGPSLNPIERLWDELEHRLVEGLFPPTLLPDLVNAPLTQTPTDKLTNLVESLFQKSGDWFSCKGSSSILMPMLSQMRYPTRSYFTSLLQTLGSAENFPIEQLLVVAWSTAGESDGQNQFTQSC